MNKLFTLFTCLSLGVVSFGQIIFESDLSSWTDGDPDGFMGVKTNIAPGNVNEVMIGAVHGTSMAQLINADGGHKRFTTQELAITELETYEVKMWITGAEGSEIRTGLFSNDGTEDQWIYSDYIDVFAETGGDLTMLTQSITVPSGCSAGEFIFSLRNTDELAGIVIDSVSIGIGSPAEEVSIYDIQYSTEPDFPSPFDGEVVITKGIVTGIFTTGGDEGRFFIQDGPGAWNGIYVYENSAEVAIGDSVVVIGEVEEFFTLTELKNIVDITVLSSGNPLPEAVEVTTGDVANEEYEGVLVKVTDAKCTNADAGFGQFEVDDNSGARLIDDEMFSYTATADNYYSITGVSFLSFGDTKIYPRSIEDIEITDYAGLEENNLVFSFCPNPASDVLFVNAPADATVAIYNVSGKMVYNASASLATIDVSEFDAGVYHISIVNNGITKTERLMIK